MAIHASWGLATLLGLASPAMAGDCRLALVLALDVSSSVNEDEDWFQREGLARALVAPAVTRSFLAGGPVALFVFEWSGPLQQVVILPWRMIHSPEDLVAVAAVIASPRDDTPRFHHQTAMGSALAFAATALKGGPDCWARTVDVSGDGESNEGLTPAAAYATSPFDGVTVNALVIAPRGADQEEEVAGHAYRRHRRLVGWFEREVLHGTGSFCITAESYEDYGRAMEAKLLRELQTPVVSGWVLAEDRPG
jgi:hypothetical protein